MPPDYAIVNERELDGRKVVEVDTNKATFQGTAWKDLGNHGKLKFENSLYLSRPKENLKITYVQTTS